MSNHKITAPNNDKNHQLTLGQSTATDTNVLKSAFFPIMQSDANAQKNSDDIAIIGGGIAAICCALQLVKKGKKVHLFCEGELANTASGNRQGALYPHLQADDSLMTQLNIKSFEYACSFYQAQAEKFDFDIDFCGVIQLAFNEKISVKQKKLLTQTWANKQLLSYITAKQVNKLSQLNINQDGIYFESGGWLNPITFIHAAAEYLIQQQKLICHQYSKVSSLQYKNSHWQLNVTQKNTIQKNTNWRHQANTVINCTGWQSTQYKQLQHISITPIQGQVTYIKPDHTTQNTSNNNQLSNLSTVICHKGYFTPSFKKGKYTGDMTIGATFDRKFSLNNESCYQSNQQNDDVNLKQQIQYLPEYTEQFSQIKLTGHKSSVRATTLDHLPIAGPVSPYNDLLKKFAPLSYGQNKNWENAILYPNLYTLTGLGARGLTTAPLLSEYISTLICNQPTVLDQKTIEALHPNRFTIKAIKQMDNPEQVLSRVNPLLD